MRFPRFARRPPRTEILAGRAPNRRLTDGWCRTIGLGWFGIAIALACVGASSQMIGRPAWWADDERWGNVVVSILVVAVFLVITFVCVWSFFRGPFVPELTAAAAVFLAISAFVDRDSSPGAAVVTAVLAGSALLFAVAGLSGRRRVTQPSSRPASSSSIAS